MVTQIKIEGKHETEANNHRINPFIHAPHGTCLEETMIPQVTLNEARIHPRDPRTDAPANLELTNDVNRSTVTKQVSKFGRTISLAMAFSAFLLPLSVLILTSNRKLQNQDFSEHILALPTYAQGIWIPIYATLFALFIWQTIPSGREPRSTNSIVFPLAVSSVINTIWLLSDASIWSLGIELLWLVNLVFVYRLLEPESATTRKLWFARAGIGFYLGWLTVTTAITVSNLLFSSWSELPLHPVFWATTVLLSLAGVGLFLALRYNDIFFNLALVWAFAGYIFRSPLEPTLMPALTVALASTVFAIVREPHQKVRPTPLDSRRTISDL